MHFLSDIVQYSYSAEELRNCVRHQDLWDYGITKNELEAKIESFSNDFLSSNCTITSLQLIGSGETQIFCPATVKDALCLRRTDHIIKKALRTPLLNRNDEVKQLLQVLSGEPKCSIFRTDIKSYFESVPFGELISILERDGLRNNCALSHLKNLNSLLINSYHYTGLPRGLALSSTLSDYALHNFDRNIFNCDTVVHYTRYVDDICIVHFENHEAIKSLVENSLPFGLLLNQAKTQNEDLPSAKNLEFLGYRISLDHPQKVDIAPKKIAKTKKRIVLSLRQFLRNKNFELLVDRLRFLSCSTRMKKVWRKQPVCTGYRHVYRLCHIDAISKQLRDLDKFLHGIVNSKRFALGRSLRAALTKEQKGQLKRLSFEKNYQNNFTAIGKPNRISEIKRAWQYE